MGVPLGGGRERNTATLNNKSSTSAAAQRAAQPSLTSRPRISARLVIGSCRRRRMLSRLKIGAAKYKLACHPSRPANKIVLTCGFRITRVIPKSAQSNPIPVSHCAARSARINPERDFVFGVRMKTPFGWISPWIHANVTVQPKLKKLPIACSALR